MRRKSGGKAFASGGNAARMNIKINLAQQQAALKTHGKSFYLAGLLLGKHEFKRAAALYALLRHIDDEIDEAPNSAVAAERLHAIHKQLQERDERQNAATAAANKEADYLEIGSSSLQEFMRGMAYDSGKVAVQNTAELLDYCYCVAGTVGEMMCSALHCSDARATQHAQDLGMAMQLTNIARDVYADAQIGRRYLPANWVDNASPRQILAPSEQLSAKVRAAIMRLIQLSQPFYKSGFHGVSLLPWRSRFAIVAAGRIYGGIGSAIYKEGAIHWQERKILSRPQKIMLAARSVGSFCVAPNLWRHNDYPGFGKPENVLVSSCWPIQDNDERN